MSYNLLLYCALETIKKHEGFSAKPYKCTAGKLTIGYGRNLEEVGISKEEAERLCVHDIEHAYKCLNSLSFFKNLNNSRKIALIDMCFQLGFQSFMRFKKTISYLETGNYEVAAAEILDSKYARQTPERAQWVSDIIKTGKLEIV